MKVSFEYKVLAGRGDKSESITAWYEEEVSAFVLQLMTSKYITNKQTHGC